MYRHKRIEGLEVAILMVLEISSLDRWARIGRKAESHLPTNGVDCTPSHRYACKQSGVCMTAVVAPQCRRTRIAITYLMNSQHVFGRVQSIVRSRKLCCRSSLDRSLSGPAVFV